MMKQSETRQRERIWWSVKKNCDVQLNEWKVVRCGSLKWNCNCDSDSDDDDGNDYDDDGDHDASGSREFVHLCGGLVKREGEENEFRRRHIVLSWVHRKEEKTIAGATGDWIYVCVFVI